MCLIFKEQGSFKFYLIQKPVKMIEFVLMVLMVGRMFTLGADSSKCGFEHLRIPYLLD